MQATSLRRTLYLTVATAGLALGSSVRADDLREALASAYNTNPNLEAARAGQRANDENVPINRATGLPTATATATHIEFVRQSGNQFTAPARNFGINLAVTAPIYSGGAVKNAIRAADERVEAGRADLRGTESSIFSQAVAAYMDVLRTEALAGLAANQVEVLKVNLDATSDRFEIGDLTRTDVAQSQSRLALAESDFQTSLSNLIAARNTYIQVIGKAPESLMAPPPLPNLPETVEMAQETALKFNPDLIAAKERADAAGFDTKVAGAGRMPTVALFANGDYSNFLGTLGGGPFTQAETTANAGVRVTIPIFQAGAIAARERQASAVETQALENMIATERSVIQQTRNAYASWQASNAIITSSKAAVEAAEVSLEGVRAENSIGNRTILDVLNAEQELLSARAQLVTARRNAYVAGFTLLATMGKAEARDLNLDTGGPLYDPTVNYDEVRNKIWDWDRPPWDTGGAPKAESNSTRTVDIPAPTASFGPQLEPGG